MSNASQFLIDNDTGHDFAVHIEPECFVVQLKQGDCLTVRETYSVAPVTLRIGKDERDRTVISIWPGDGDVVVERNGVSVMDLG
jgi:hypothetical protein